MITFLKSKKIWALPAHSRRARRRGSSTPDRSRCAARSMEGLEKRKGEKILKSNKSKPLMFFRSIHPQLVVGNIGVILDIGNSGVPVVILIAGSPARAYLARA